MKDKFLSSGIFIVALILGAALILPDRNISRFMQSCGQMIADVLGY